MKKIIEKNNFSLFELHKGLYAIVFNFESEHTTIADVVWDSETNERYIKSWGTRLQDYITSWERYSDFIYLVDEAFFRFECEAKQ